jgi:hypothetical protein
MKKQTAVEWLFKWMIDNKDSIIEERLQAFEQAKQMEREQIEDAWNSASGGDAYYTGEQYYNETYSK